MKILTVGTIYIDIKGHSFSEFIPDGRNAGYIEYVHGGVGRNIAEDVRNLGAESVFLSLYGPDGASADAVSHLKDIGIDTQFMKKDKNGCGTWLAVFDEQGNVVSSISARPDLSALCSVLEERSEEIFKDLDAVILEIDIPKDVVTSVFESAKKYGVPVYCGVATMSHALELKNFLKNAECFICNLQEAGMLFDTDLPEGDPEAVLSFLRENLSFAGIRSMVVTMGDKGSVYVSESGESGSCPAEKVTQADSTGAGDSFCAAFTIARTKEMSFKDACLAASQTAACVVSSNENVYTGPAMF